MNAQWINVFHITNGDTIIELVSHHFIFDLFPALETLVDENLIGHGKGRRCELNKLFTIMREP